jgi:hypothetical protein
MSSVDRALDELAAVPPRDFAKARAALVARLKREGAQDAAKTVAAMRRPTMALWAVNRLALDAKDTIDALIETTQQMKSAQLGRSGSAAELAAATARQRALLAELSRRAEDLLSNAGGRGSQTLLRQIATTLIAGASDDETRELLRKGRLDRELEPLGFDVFGGAMPATRGDRIETPAPSSPGPARPIATIEPDRRQQRDAERAERRAQAEQEAKRRRAEALAEIERLRGALDQATDRVARAKEDMERSAEAVRDAMRTESGARRALADAEKRLRHQPGGRD